HSRVRARQRDRFSVGLLARSAYDAGARKSVVRRGQGMATCTVLISGATGMVGFALAKRLVDDGYTVRAMVRNPRQPGPLAGLRVELVAGDLAAPETLPATLRGVQKVVHAA